MEQINETCGEDTTSLAAIIGMPIENRTETFQRLGINSIQQAQQQAQETGLPFDTITIAESATVLSYTVALTESEKQSLATRDDCGCSANGSTQSTCSGRESHENSSKGRLRNFFDGNLDVDAYLELITNNLTKSEILAPASILSEMLWMRACEGALVPVLDRVIQLMPGETAVVSVREKDTASEAPIDWSTIALSSVPAELTVVDNGNGSFNITLASEASPASYTFDYIASDFEGKQVVSNAMVILFQVNQDPSELAWNMCDGTFLRVGAINEFQNNYTQLIFRIYSELADAFSVRHSELLSAGHKDGADFILAAVEKLRKAYLSANSIRQWPSRSTVRSWISRRATWDMLSELNEPTKVSLKDGNTRVQTPKTADSSSFSLALKELNEAIRKDELPKAGLLRDVFGPINESPSCFAAMTFAAVQTAVLYHWIGYSQAKVALVRGKTRAAVKDSLTGKKGESQGGSWNKYMKKWVKDKLKNDFKEDQS